MHAAFSVWSWYVVDGQAEHDPVPAWPAEHAAQLCLFDETAQPSPDLHDVAPEPSCHWFAGQLLHDDLLVWSWNWPAPQFAQLAKP